MTGSWIMAAACLCLLTGAGLVAWLLMQRTRSAQLRRFMALLSPDAEVDAASPRRDLVDMLPSGMADRLSRAGWTPTMRQALSWGVGAILALIAIALKAGLFAAMLAALTFFLALAALVEFRAQRRMRLLSDSMLGFLERVRQLLSVGNSLSVSLARAAENSPPIVAQYLAPTIRRINNGNGVAESLERCAGQLDIYELHLLATAARTNLRFGGSMTQILRNIIENIRKRAAVERELRANTTEVRSSAWVLAVLPMFVATIVMLTNTGYSRWFLQTQTGHKMIAYAIVSQMIGGYLMRLIIRTRY